MILDDEIEAAMVVLRENGFSEGKAKTCMRNLWTALSYGTSEQRKLMHRYRIPYGRGFRARGLYEAISKLSLVPMGRWLSFLYIRSFMAARVLVKNLARFRAAIDEVMQPRFSLLSLLSSRQSQLTAQSVRMAEWRAESEEGLF